LFLSHLLCSGKWFQAVEVVICWLNTSYLYISMYHFIYLMNLRLRKYILKAVRWCISSTVGLMQGNKKVMKSTQVNPGIISHILAMTGIFFFFLQVTWTCVGPSVFMFSSNRTRVWLTSMHCSLYLLLLEYWKGILYNKIYLFVFSSLIHNHSLYYQLNVYLFLFIYLFIYLCVVLALIVGGWIMNNELERVWKEAVLA
jgi:hypothetical protein